MYYKRGKSQKSYFLSKSSSSFKFFNYVYLQDKRGTDKHGRENRGTRKTYDSDKHRTIGQKLTWEETNV